MNHKNHKKSILYQGKSKIIYEGPEPGMVILHFKDDVFSPNNQMLAKIPSKGILSNRISEFLMQKLSEIGIPTHFVKTLNMREQLTYQLEMIPLEIVVRNIASGSICDRLGVDEGFIFPSPIVEFYQKNTEFHEPLLCEDHLRCLNILTEQDLVEIRFFAGRINDFLSGIFAGLGFKLIDFQIEFGRMEFDESLLGILLADELTPDTISLWDVASGKKFARNHINDINNIKEGYHEIAKRIGVITENYDKH